MGYVYKITNTVNQKHYIGISIHEPETGRIKKHLTGHGNRILANAVKKYGRDAFIYEILEDNVFPELLPDLEIAYIKEFNTVRPNGYNLTYGGEGGIPCEETREKISRAKQGESRSQETREKISRAKQGKPLSQKTRKKIGLANRGKSHSQETREKISRALRGKSHSQEIRKKISRACRGRPAWNKGKFLSPDKEPARELFFSLPITLPLSERRKIVGKKIS